MSPPPAAALALLGVWVLMVFWATHAAALSQARSGDRLDSIVPDERLETLEEPSSGTATDERSFSIADD